MKVSYNAETGETTIVIKGAPYKTAPLSSSQKNKLLASTGGNKPVEVTVGKKKVTAFLGVNFYCPKG